MPPITFVSACLNPAPDGTRNRSAKILIGMLARKGPLPPDAVDAALALLLEDFRNDYSTCEDVVCRIVAEGWRDALEASERSLTFVVKVLLAWNDCRASPTWEIEHTEHMARSLWRTATAACGSRIDPAPTCPPLGFTLSPDPAVNGGWRWSRVETPEETRGGGSNPVDGWARDENACLVQAWCVYHEMITEPIRHRAEALTEAIEEMLLAADKGELRKVHVAAAQVGARVDYATGGDSVVWEGKKP